MKRKEKKIWIVSTPDGSIWAKHTVEEARALCEQLVTSKWGDGGWRPTCCLTELTLKKDVIWDEYVDRYFPIKDKPGDFQRAAVMPI